MYMLKINIRFVEDFLKDNSKGDENFEISKEDNKQLDKFVYRNFDMPKFSYNEEFLKQKVSGLLSNGGQIESQAKNVNFQLTNTKIKKYSCIQSLNV